jgi:hypothetical protein
MKKNESKKITNQLQKIKIKKKGRKRRKKKTGRFVRELELKDKN